jgi:PKD repeat protein
VEESEEQAILHTFEEEGTYNVTVDITDDDELIASDSIEITVEETESESGQEGEEVDEGETNNLPTVQIVSNDIEGEAPATFEFRAEIAGGTEPHTISWDFGDDSEGSDEEIVEHTYDDPGTYNVVVAITDSDGETASDSIEITVE